MKFPSASLLASLLAIGLLMLGCDEQETSGSSDSPAVESKPLPIDEPELEDIEEVVELDTAGHFDEIPDHSTDVELKPLHAKFVEFELGDASHFIFEDESGEIWDFGGCEGSDCDFAMGLPEEEADESNQGWGSNPDAVGKWFDLLYYETERELYIDGPVGTVYVIAVVQ